jgi:DNA repair exonuclease SbcCD ATPase subunit
MKAEEIRQEMDLFYAERREIIAELEDMDQDDPVYSLVWLDLQAVERKLEELYDELNNLEYEQAR